MKTLGGGPGELHCGRYMHCARRDYLNNYFPWLTVYGETRISIRKIGSEFCTKFSGLKMQTLDFKTFLAC